MTPILDTAMYQNQGSRTSTAAYFNVPTEAWRRTLAVVMAPPLRIRYAPPVAAVPLERRTRPRPLVMAARVEARGPGRAEARPSRALARRRRVARRSARR